MTKENNFYHIDDDNEENDAAYEAAMTRNIEDYHNWLEKMQNWSWQQILQKLRGVHLSTSRSEYIDLAQDCRSAYELSMILLEQIPVGKNAIQNLGVLWAGVESLWEQFLPDFPCLEDLLIDLNNSETIEDGLEIWDELLEDILNDPQPLGYDEAISLYPIGGDWLDDAIGDLGRLLMDDTENKGKLNLAGLKMFERITNAIDGVEEQSGMYARTQAWVAFVNGDAASVDKWVAEATRLGLGSNDFFEQLGDWHKAPPTYAFTPANPVRAMEFYNKMLDQLAP